MADTGKAPQIDPIDEVENRLRQGFIDATGQGGGAVRVERKDEKTGRKYNCGSYEIPDGDYDAFVSELSNDYPDGGAFICRVVGPRGSIISNGIIYLEKNRRAKAAAPAVVQAAPATNDNFEKYMMLIMDQQRHSSDMMFKMMMGFIQAGQGNKSSDSPLELLNGVLEAQARLTPPRLEEKNTIDQVLDTMGKLRAAFPDAAPAEGVGGIINAMAPILAAAMANQQQAAAPQQGKTVNPAVAGPGTPPPRTAAQPSPGTQTPAPTPESINTPEGQQQFMARVQPHILAIQNLIGRAVEEDGFNLAEADDADGLAQEIANYLYMAARAMLLLELDRDYLLATYQQQPQAITVVLAMVGITEPLHVQVIERAITLHAEQLASEAAADGPGGNETSA